MSGQVTGWVLRNGPKDRAMRAVLITIADAANRDGEHAHPGITAMVEGSGYSRATVLDATRRLVDERWVAVEEEGGGRGRTTVYRVLMEDDEKGSEDWTVSEAKGSDPQAERVRTTESAPISSTVKTNAVSFDDFWNAYPRRTGKGSARTAWARAIKKVDPPSLLAATKRYAASGDLPEEKFIPHPSRWLNDERWADGFEEPKSPDSGATDFFGRQDGVDPGFVDPSRFE